LSLVPKMNDSAVLNKEDCFIQCSGY
jgi:hypothetical protein